MSYEFGKPLQSTTDDRIVVSRVLLGVQKLALLLL